MGFLGSSKPKKQIVGYKYSLGMHLILGYSNADGVKQIWVGEKCVWPSPNNPDNEAADGATIANIDAEKIFGGTDKEGGIKGSVDIEYGEANQLQNNYLVAKINNAISAYRGLLGVILKCVYLGTSPYIKVWSFLIKRTDKLVSGTAQWYPAKAVIRPDELDGDDLNPIHIIRECLLDKEWGLNWSVSDINDDNFKAAADILYTEEFGLSVIWDNTKAVEDFIGMILEVIAGMLYQNMATGKWEIGLTREPTAGELAAIESFNEDQILDIDDFSRPGYGEITDQVTINFHNKIYDKNRSITVHDKCLIEKQAGAIIDNSFNFYSVCNEALANKLASRELKTATSMLAAMRIKANRQMSHLKPNDIFKLSWSNLGIVDMIIRVVGVNYGNLDKNEIVLQCCEDVFEAAYTIYEDPPDTQWTDPVNDPIDTVYRMLMEVPYWHLCNYSLGQDFTDTLDDDIALMLACAIKPIPDAYEYDLLVRFDPTSPFEDEGYGDFASSVTLKNSLARTVEEDGAESWIDVENISMLDAVLEGTYAIIASAAENEIVLIIDKDEINEKIKIARGILDTKPSAHLAGDRIWFVKNTSTVVCKDFMKDDTPGVKFLTKTGRGILDAGAATIETADAFDSRMIRPYLPGNFKINGERYPAYLYGQPALTWSHRDRTDQDQLRNLIKHADDTDYGQEAGATYTIQFLTVPGGVVKRTITGLTGKTYTYPAGEEVTDFGKIQHKLRMKLWTVRGAYNSWQIYDITLERPLYGSSAAQSTASGTLTRLGTRLKGSSTAQSTAIGTLTEI